MKKLRFVLSLAGDHSYLKEQAAVASSIADRLGIELLTLNNAKSDAILQSQQLLELIQSNSGSRPDAFIVEPASATGLPRVAEAAVAAGIGWAVSNTRVNYIAALRRISDAPSFTISQDHLELGRTQGRQIGAILPKGGTLLHLRGPTTSSVATQRTEGMESAKPQNVQVKFLKSQWTVERAFDAVSAWLRLPRVKPSGTQAIASQHVDFIVGARKAFQQCTQSAERAQWLALPCLGIGTSACTRPLLDEGILTAAVVTALTVDTAIDMLIRAIHTGSQPPEHTFVKYQSQPSIESLAATHRLAVAQ